VFGTSVGNPIDPTNFGRREFDVAKTAANKTLVKQ